MLDVKLYINIDFSFVVNIHLCLRCVQNAIYQQRWGLNSLHYLVCDRKIHISYWYTSKKVRKSGCTSARLGLGARIEGHIDNVRMAADKCKRGVKTKGRSLDALSAIKVTSANDSDAS